MFSSLLESTVGWIWHYPVVSLCVLGGVWFTISFRFVQLRTFSHAIDLIRGKFDQPNETGEITHFQALCAALSGTIGLGNIAGVAIAIALGGPGAVFWMWIIGFLAMATKFVECTLGTHYRDTDGAQVRGGPMYYITKGLGPKWRPVGLVFAALLAMAAIGAGNMFQTNQAASVLNFYYQIPKAVTGLVLLTLSGLVILGGIKRIGQVASRIIPFMCVVYVVGAILVCVLNWQLVPHAFWIIMQDAFTGQAAAGGSIVAVILMGVRRAVFSNEAGLGTASIAHAAVKTEYPIREGFVASLGPLIDTIVVCTATALVIVMSGFFGTEMYQAQPTSLSFESPAQVLLQPGWSIAQADSVSNTHPLISYQEGDHVLHYQGQAQRQGVQFSGDQFMDPTERDHLDGIRFSYLNQSGTLHLILKDRAGAVLGEVQLGSNGPVLGDGSAWSKVVGGTQDTQDWQGLVLLFQPEFKSQLVSGAIQLSDLILELVPASSDVDWYFDRVQGVRNVAGIDLTTVAFDRFLTGFGSIFITIAVFFFAFSTLITWSYYGEISASYVFGSRAVVPYKVLFVGMAFVGAVKELTVILNFSDLFVGLLVIPNMIALILLSPRVKEWMGTYLTQLKLGEFKPVKSYMDIDVKVLEKEPAREMDSK